MKYHPDINVMNHFSEIDVNTRLMVVETAKLMWGEIADDQYDKLRETLRITRFSTKYTSDDDKIRIGVLKGMCSSFHEEYEVDCDDMYYNVKQIIINILNVIKDTYPKRKTVYLLYHKKNQTIKVFSTYGKNEYFHQII